MKNKTLIRYTAVTSKYHGEYFCADNEEEHFNQVFNEDRKRISQNAGYIN